MKVVTLLWRAVLSCLHHCWSLPFSHKKEAGKKKASLFQRFRPRADCFSWEGVGWRKGLPFLPKHFHKPHLHPQHWGGSSLDGLEPQEGHLPLGRRARSQNFAFNVLLFKEHWQKFHSWGMYALKVWYFKQGIKSLKNEVEATGTECL